MKKRKRKLKKVRLGRIHRAPSGFSFRDKSKYTRKLKHMGEDKDECDDNRTS